MTPAAPTSRWTQCTLHPQQRAFWQSTAMINAVSSCRRSWKTEGAKRRLIRAALSPSRYVDRKFYACAPTHQQARDIFWNDLKALTPTWALATGNPDRDIRESDLSIHLRNGSIVRVVGTDKPSRLEGGFCDGATVDEFGDCRPEVVQQHLLPMCVREGAYLDIIGTPSGRNHWYTLVEQIKAGEVPNAAHFTWTGAEVLHLYLGRERSEAVLAQARASMDEDTFAQEWEGAFTSPRDQVYYGFDAADHVEPCPYDPKATLLLGFDFNVSPGVAVLAQERLYRGDNPVVDRTKPVTMCIDEIWVETNSNTLRVCQEIIERYGNHQGGLLVYADATGGSRGTSQVDGSDLDLIEKSLGRVFGGRSLRAGSKVVEVPSRLMMDVPRSNPPVRSRVNSVNARLRSVDGTIRLLVDPKCRKLARDLEGCQFRKGSSDIDKQSAPDLSHISDALGYLVHRRHPMSPALFDIEMI